uniref:Alternative protein CCDC111 n=1 Tax=Homo sapiens TaxID=9606 RepID=L8E975_HUMAN|nr:alternative protein CCDC111 [Homo sapiens]
MMIALQRQQAMDFPIFQKHLQDKDFLSIKCSQKRLQRKAGHRIQRNWRGWGQLSKAVLTFHF